MRAFFPSPGLSTGGFHAGRRSLSIHRHCFSSGSHPAQLAYQQLQVVGRGTHLGLEVRRLQTDPTAPASVVVMGELKDHAFNAWALLDLPFEAFGLVVSIGCQDPISVIRNENMSHGGWALAAVAALRPAWAALGKIRLFPAGRRLALPTLTGEEAEAAAIGHTGWVSSRAGLPIRASQRLFIFGQEEVIGKIGRAHV